MTIKSLVKCDVSKDRSRKPKNAKHRRRESSSCIQESRERSTTPRGQPGWWSLDAGFEQQEGCLLHCDLARVLLPRRDVSSRTMQASETLLHAAQTSRGAHNRPQGKSARMERARRPESKRAGGGITASINWLYLRRLMRILYIFYEGMSKVLRGGT